MSIQAKPSDTAVKLQESGGLEVSANISGTSGPGNS